MIRILLGALAVALSVPSAAAGQRSLPMQFEWWQEGAAEVCGDRCRTWVSAIGTITSDTPLDFANFAREHDLRGTMLVLDSGGGSVHGAMALGRQVRQLGMVTTVGKTIEVAGRPGAAQRRARLSPQADCESMCVFVLLAGSKRVVPRGARLLVHQIWLGDRRDDAAAATYSAEDLVLVQRDIGRLAQYTVEMGASIDFLEMSLRIPPWEPMRVLARDEIRRMRVDTAPDDAVASLEPATAASAPALTSGARRGPETAARGWLSVERSGRPMLVRSHPLTVEGEEIGRFDLTLSCGATPESLDVAYDERRLRSGDVAIPLKTVTLSFGARAESLQVVAPATSPSSGEWSTQARGSVPVAFIRAFSEMSSRALVVATVNGDEERTVTRVGSSGITAALARLQKSCGDARPLHAGNARTGQADAR